jgi:polyisoprenoid-binding protein YceI
LPDRLGRRAVLAGATLWAAGPQPALAASDRLHIGDGRGTIDFSIGDSRIFRTTGGFKKWNGSVMVDDGDVPHSSVSVVVDTRSIQMLDPQQTAMLRDVDFFDVERFPEMSFASTRIDRTGDSTLKVLGDLTLRGISKPMTLDVAVTERQPNAPVGKRYAIFKAEGSLKRSEYGMTKFIDVVGDNVDISIRTDAWR